MSVVKSYLKELFVVEGTLDEIMSDNGPPLMAKNSTAFTSWEEPCNKKGNPNGFNSSLCISSYFAGKVHQAA